MDHESTNDVYEDKNGMDCAANSMLFAEELIDYVLKKLDFHWNRQSGVQKFPEGSVSKRFTPEIGECVFEIIGSNIHNIKECYKSLLAMNIHSIEDYRREACVTATMHFPTGYDAETFLTYSALLVGVSAFYFASGNACISDATAQMLSYIINYFIYQCVFKPSGDWFNLCLVAQSIRRSFRVEGVEFVLPCSPKSAQQDA